MQPVYLTTAERHWLTDMMAHVASCAPVLGGAPADLLMRWQCGEGPSVAEWDALRKKLEARTGHKPHNTEEER